MIATGRQSADGAIVPTIREGFGHVRSAHARLRGSARVCLRIEPASVFCFVGDKSEELRPSCVVNGLRQHSASESLHVQILDGDEAGLVDQLARFLVVEVAPLVSDMNVRALQQQHRFAAPVSALLAPGDLSLAAPQPGFGIPVMPPFSPLTISATQIVGSPSTNRWT